MLCHVVSSINTSLILQILIVSIRIH